MPQDLKTGEAIKADVGELNTAGKELIDTGRTKVADTADSIKEKVKVDEPTILEKGIEKIGNAFTRVKEATVG